MLSLHEISELENKWKTYNIKKNKGKRFSLYIVFFLFILALLFASSYYFYTKGVEELSFSIEDINKEVKSILAEKKVKFDKNNEVKNEVKTKAFEEKNSNREILLSESNKIFNILNENNEEENAKVNALPSLILNKINIDKNKYTTNKSILKDKIPVEVPLEKQNLENVSGIDNKKIEPKDELEYLKSKFETNKNVKYAVKISEEYYSKGNFSESRKWALIANKIDSNNEESWILFAKSSYKLGLKEQAIKSLKNYLSNNQSTNVRKILDSIYRGKI